MYPGATTEHPTETQMKEMIEIVRQRIQGTEFPLARRTDSQFLAKFIRSKRYDVDKAVTAVDNYYNHLHANIRYVDGLQPAKFADMYDMNLFRLLKNSFEGSRIIHMAICNWNTKMASLREVEQLSSFLMEEIFQNDISFQLNGFIGIMDLSGFGFCHVRQATYNEIKFALKIILHMLPIKIAGIHVLNAPTLFWPVFKIASSLLPQKIRDRIYFHSSLEEMNKALNPEILPKFLGGMLDDEEAFDTEFIPNIVERNLPYDCYWNAAFDRPSQPRRLTRKRSSMMMMS